MDMPILATSTLRPRLPGMGCVRPRLPRVRLPRPRLLARDPFALAISGYLLLVTLVEVGERLGVAPAAERLASTPAGVAEGRVWQLFTSGLTVDGPVLPQLAGMALVAWVLARRYGARAFWSVALAGHLGSTVLVYLGLGFALLLGGGHLGELLTMPDFGISCVWSGAVGALAAGVLRDGVRRGATRVGLPLSLALLGMVAAATVASGSLAQLEHPVAFVLGAVVLLAVAREQRTATRDRSGDRPAAERRQADAGRHAPELALG